MITTLTSDTGAQAAQPETWHLGRGHSPRTLDRAELWLEIDRHDGPGWDVRSVQIEAVWPTHVLLRTSSAAAASAIGSRALICQSGPCGLVQWDAELDALASVPVAELDASGADAPGAGDELAQVPAHEALFMLRVAGGTASGLALERRHAPRFDTGLTPVRLLIGSGRQWLATPPGIEAWPVVRLVDLSASGAGVVIDCPLPAGTPVVLELPLPGAADCVRLEGSIVLPAVDLHGEAQPQPDGLIGFRRGIVFRREAARGLSDHLARAMAALGCGLETETSA